jgi:hypothetical protein
MHSHVARRVGMRNANKMLVGKPKKEDTILKA